MSVGVKNNVDHMSPPSSAFSSAQARRSPVLVVTHAPPRSPRRPGGHQAQSCAIALRASLRSHPLYRLPWTLLFTTTTAY